MDTPPPTPTSTPGAQGATPALPPRPVMLEAFMERDPRYEGVFVTGVRTTGIFCRPTCAARKPRPENVEFFVGARDALEAGYRPCRRCRPLRPAGDAPDWLRPLLGAVEEDPARRWRDRDLRGMGLEPARVRRWFKAHHGMTFHAYSRARRLGEALGRIRDGDGVARAAFDAGYDSLSGFGEAFRKLAGQPPSEARDGPVVRVARIATPLGPVVAGATADAVVLLEFADRTALPRQVRLLAERTGWVFAPGHTPVLDALRDALEAYFAGEDVALSLPVDTPGTPFQRQVWAALREIPRGETRSYGEVARALGRPSAVRAVARANGANRVAILVPCHRVVGADGTMTGYGGGVWRKRRLLALEREGIPILPRGGGPEGGAVSG